ncbi:MAG: hypothetical protein MUO76_13560 [Anaerolineaceae bacterium]|nr:hypothetical protein [Anaerolineaceae bacterium]
MIVVAFFMVLDFHSRTTNLYQVKSQWDLINEEVNDLKKTEQSFLYEIEFAGSDAGVEGWAREEKHEVQPEDIRVIPVAQYEISPTPTPLIIQQSKQVNNWEVWFAIFFETSWE